MEISKINQHTIKYSLILLLLISMVLSGCLNKNLNTEADPTKIATTEIVVMETKPVQSPTLTLTPTRQETLIPTFTNTVRETSTPTPTITATWAPPILNDYSIQTLIDTNGNCELPCWWGLEPGVTTKEQFLSYLEKMNINNIESSGKNALQYDSNVIGEVFLISYTLPGGNGIGNLQIVFHNDIFSYIRVDTNTAVYRYQLESTLKKLGKPDEILLYVISRGPGNTKPFVFVLIYKNKRTAVAYGPDGFEVEENIQLCINNFEKPVLITWEDEVIFFERIDQRFLGGDVRKLQSLEDATRLTIDDFYDQFTDPLGSDCFETSIEFWDSIP